MSKDSSASTPLSHLATATLVALCPEEETAKRIESQLRNAGYPVRVPWVNDLEDFEDALKRSHPDLVLCALNAQNISAPDVVRLAAREAPDLPTLFVAEGEFTIQDTVSALEAGARDLVGAGDHQQLKHLEQVCLRECREHYRRRELRMSRSRLAEFELQHKSLLDETVEAVVHVQEGIIIDANSAFAALLGYETAKALVELPLMDLIAKEGLGDVKNFLKLVSKGKAPKEPSLALQLKAVDDNTVKATAQITLGQKDGETLITLLVRAEAPPEPEVVPVEDAEPEAAPQAFQHPTIAGALEKAIKANVGMHRALCVAMVDSFASIEQRLGYQEAEAALEQAGARIQQRLIRDESMFRSSTALFTIVLSRPNQDEFSRFAELLREEISAQLFKTASYETHLTATVVCYPVSSGDVAGEVIDMAVSEARKLSRDGGNQTAIVGKTAESVKEAQEDLRKADQVKRALMDGRLRLAYQSIASLSGEGQHFDVLVRMLDASGHEVPAKDFIPAAERHGVIIAVDRWVISRTLGVLSKRQGTGDQTAMFVRISEHTLREGDTFLKWFAEQLKLRRIQNNTLVVAINEAIVETHVSKATALCEALRRFGVDVALDHYGVGPKPQQVLERIPATYVRFDYKFSKDFGDETLQETLTELMQHAKSRNAMTIMGQVENATAMARLWQLGVDYIQGYHIQAPEAVLMAADLKS